MMELRGRVFTLCAAGMCALAAAGCVSHDQVFIPNPSPCHISCDYDPISPIDPHCHGFHPTCWRPWCGVCPPCPPPTVGVATLAPPWEEVPPVQIPEILPPVEQTPSVPEVKPPTSEGELPMSQLQPMTAAPLGAAESSDIPTASNMISQELEAKNTAGISAVGSQPGPPILIDEPGPERSERILKNVEPRNEIEDPNSGLLAEQIVAAEPHDAWPQPSPTQAAISGPPGHASDSDLLQQTGPAVTSAASVAGP